MSIAFTGNADVELMRAMIPHHKEAIDMARVMLKYGTRRYATLRSRLSRHKEQAISTMRAWLGARGY